MNGTDNFHSAVTGGSTDVLFSYSVMFKDGFEFNMGGKIPGACKFALSLISSLL